MLTFVDKRMPRSVPCPLIWWFDHRWVIWAGHLPVSGDGWITNLLNFHDIHYSRRTYKSVIDQNESTYACPKQRAAGLRPVVVTRPRI
jgi:hypothetical protein